MLPLTLQLEILHCGLERQEDSFKISQQVTRSQDLEPWLLTPGSVFFSDMTRM